MTGDATHLRTAFDDEITYPVDVDTKTARATVRRLKLLAEAEQAPDLDQP